MNRTTDRSQPKHPASRDVTGERDAVQWLNRASPLGCGRLSQRSWLMMSADHDPILQHHVPCPGCGYDVAAQVAEDIGRCPECGHAFDPAEIADSFQVKWPVLMKWFLLAHALAAIISAVLVVHCIRTHTAPSLTAGITSHATQLTNCFLFMIPGLVAAIGLHRHREWGRKACMVTFAMVVLARLMSVPFLIWRSGESETSPGPIDILSLLSRFWPSAILWILLSLFVTTGLRRHTLTGRSGQRVLLLSRRQFEPCRDWLLLLVVVFVGQGAGSVGHLLYYWSQQDWYISCPYAGSQSLYHLTLVAESACALWSWVLAVLLWKRPETTRPLVAIFLTLVVLESGCLAAWYLLWTIYAPMQLPMVLSVFAMFGRWLSDVLPSASLLIFAVWHLTAGDIRSVAPQRRGVEAEETAAGG